MSKVIDRELDVPYTVVGHTSLMSNFSMLLDGKGIKKVVSQLKDGESLRVIFRENAIEMTAVRSEEDGREDVTRIKEIHEQQKK